MSSPAVEGPADAWILACRADAVEPGEGIRLDTEPPIGLFNVDGDFFAVDDTCSHAQSSLAEDGLAEGDQVECGYHFARFCLRTGAALTLPATAPLRTYAVERRDGGVYVNTAGLLDSSRRRTS